MKKQFKVVFRNESSTYELWFTDNKNEWVKSVIYYTFDNDLKVIESRYDGPAVISESILWEMNKFINLGYKFIGIQKA